MRWRFGQASVARGTSRAAFPLSMACRSAEGQINRLPKLAAELVRLKVDVIITWFTPTAVAAKQATHEIPIVMAETGDPVGTGLVASLPLPGGNVTGIAPARVFN